MTNTETAPNAVGMLMTAAIGSQVFLTELSHEQEALTFQLGEQEYGIRLNCVQEIRSYQMPTRLAGARDDLLGVIDLRGEVIPLFDLRRRFALPSALFGELTVIIVISLEDRRIAVVADQVNDVVALKPDQIRRMPPMQGSPDQRHLVAIASVGDRRLVLLDIESLLRSAALPVPDAVECLL